MTRGKRSAEERRRDLEDLAGGRGDAFERDQLAHDLHVYQEELAAQNDVLREAQSELEEARDRFIELYDFAPNGYLTLDEHGVILRINLTGASWLGKSKTALEGMPLLVFVHDSDRMRLVDFLRDCRQRAEGHALTADVRIRNADGSRSVQLLCRPHVKPLNRVREFFTAMVDITERRGLEAEREETLHNRAALTGRIISIQEAERQRIARDLHDNIGQQVTALRLKLDAIELALGDNPAAQQRLAEAQSISEALDRALDFIAAELRPASLDLGFTSALEQFVREWSQTFGIHVELEVPPTGQMRLTPDAETHLYRIVQEALHNVYKHADAHSVVVRLTQSERQLRLIIEDDGIGPQGLNDPKRSRRGLGLESMRERAQLIGATVKFNKGTSGRGTRIVVEISPSPMAREPKSVR